MKRLSSVATGQLNAASEQSAQAGRRHGEPASASEPSGSALTDATAAQVAAWLASMEPRKADDRLQSHLQRFGFSISIKTESRFPQKGGMRTIPVAAVVTPNSPQAEFSGSSADKRAALAIVDVQRFMTPPTREQVIAWLAEVDTLTTRFAQDEGDSQATLAAYGRRLMEYPADIVRQVLRAWPSKSEKWPQWANLEPDLERLTKPRRLMLHALAQPRQDDGKPVSMPPPSPERRRELIDEVNEMIDPMREGKRNV